MTDSPGLLFAPDFDRFFHLHEKMMWHLGAIDFGSLRRDLLTQEDVAAVRGAMLVESHNPVYTTRLLDFFRHDHEMTSFIVTWSYEEMKHYAVLRTYLESCGMVDEQDLDDELRVTRAGPWGEAEMGFTRVQSFTYTMIQEQVTGRFYRNFADATREPLLKEILRIIAKDEYRHCQFYLEKGKQELDADRGRLKEVDDVLLNFEMPGPTFMDYERHLEAGMRVAPFDLSAMKETVDKIAQLTGKLHLLKLATDSAFHHKLKNELGLDLRMVLSLGR